MAAISYALESPNEEKQNTDVFIKLDINNATSCISFLIQQNIPFEVNYQPVLSKNPAPNPSVDLNHAIVKEEPIRRHKLPDNPIHAKIAAIYQKYMVDEIETMPITAEVAQQLGMSISTFKKIFMEQYGAPFYKLYIEKKMERAASLLKQGFKAQDVSMRVGYGEKSAIKFNKMFQKHFGLTPKKYQMMYS
jgi:AraC-like DNA-binding protein